MGGQAGVLNTVNGGGSRQRKLLEDLLEMISEG